MFRTASSRILARQSAAGLPTASFASAVARNNVVVRRGISTAPPAQKSRSWKSLAARLGLAGAVVYYYNTTDVFAEEPQQLVQPLPETDTESETLPTIDALAAQRAERKAIAAELEKQKAAQAAASSEQGDQEQGEAGLEDLEAEADQQGAFNPETGEINWDCPCLGGMADGPCGEEFKAAFSCFVYSKEEPKGMDCIDKFKDMQGCFRQYPEIYGSEIDADDEDAESESESSASTPAAAPAAESAEPQTKSPSPAKSQPLTTENSSLDLVPGNYKPSPSKHSEEQDVEPRAAFDTRAANENVSEK